jgi:hypothetical protein
MAGYFSTGQSPQRAVVLMEEEEQGGYRGFPQYWNEEVSSTLNRPQQVP